MTESKKGRGRPAIKEYKREDISKGTMEVGKLSTYEPKSPEEVERLHNLDTSLWKLTAYWSKQRSDDMWLVSALFSRKKEGELTVTDAGEIIDRIFSDKKFISYKIHKSLTNNKALFVYVSDKHVAASVSGSMYKNDYNGVTYEDRLDFVTNEIFYLTSVFGRFDDLFLIDLGDKMDGLDGFTTRKGHKLPQNMNNREAFETAIRVEKGMYDKLFTSGSANQYHVIQNCNSNHGGDFDYMVNRALEIYTNVKYPDVKTLNLEKFIEHIEYGKHILLLSHGKDTEDRKHGLPLTLNDKTENFITKYMMYHKIDPDVSCVSFIKGDLHQASTNYPFGFRYKNIPSIFGSSKWIHNNMGPGRPGAGFDIIEKDTDRVFEYTLFLK